MGNTPLLEIDRNIVADCFKTFSLYDEFTDRITFSELDIPNLVTYHCGYPGQSILRWGDTRIAFLIDLEKDCSLMTNKTQGIFVNPTLRGRGHGRELVSIMEEITRRHGLSRVQLRNVDNPEFWEHIGYKCLSGRDFYKNVK